MRDEPPGSDTPRKAPAAAAGPEIIETERLILRPLTMTDAPAIQKYFPHWNIVKYLGDDIPWPYPEDGGEKWVKKTLERQQKQHDEGKAEEWVWGIVAKDRPNDEVIGIVHLRRDPKRGNRCFWLAEEFQGKGYMSEAVPVVNDHAFDVLGFDRLLVDNAADNKASHRLKEKMGARMVRTEKASHLGGILQSEVWELTREAWHNFRATIGKKKKQRPSLAFPKPPHPSKAKAPRPPRQTPPGTTPRP